MNRLAATLLAAALLAPGPAAAQYPLFDSHIHYSRPDWDTYTPETILAILAKAGVKRALVSSTPDDGTLKLYDKAPGTIVPSLRVYRTRDDMSRWPRDPAIATYVEERFKRGIYRAIGEAHYGAADVTAPTLKRLAELAAQHKVFFWSHIDDATVEWSEQESPFVAVAKLHIPPQTFTTQDQQTFCENLSMNPWHGVGDWLPLGSLSPVRLGYRSHVDCDHVGRSRRLAEPAYGDQRGRLQLVCRGHLGPCFARGQDQ